MSMDEKGKQRMSMIMYGMGPEVKEAPSDHHHHLIGTTSSGGGGLASSDEEEQPQQQRQKAGSVPMDVMKRKKVGTESSNSTTKCCQIERCSADMGDAKPYHRRHKVCEAHAKAEFVFVGGTRQRFCQQCSRFHELSEFDESKRSCRRRLAGHNERRRKSTYPAEPNSGQKIVNSSSGGQFVDEKVCGSRKVDAKGKDHVKHPGKGQLQACPN